MDSFLLRDVFVWLLGSDLRNLELAVLSGNELLLDPSVTNVVEFETGRHDHLLSPVRTSLKCIQSIQSLTVIDHRNRAG